MTHTTITSTGAEEAEARGWGQLFFVAIIAFALGMLAVAIPVGVVAWWVA